MRRSSAAASRPFSGLDLDKAGMEEAEIKFSRTARTADVAVFYYSGHAMQHDGVNYLFPVDAALTDEADLRRLARVDDILADLQQAKNLRILVLDSCRDNPLAEQLKRSIGASRGASIQRGLARIDNLEGMIISYATQAGRTADDGHGRNSPYTAAFLKHFEEPHGNRHDLPAHRRRRVRDHRPHAIARTVAVLHRRILSARPIEYRGPGAAIRRTTSRITCRR